MTDDGKLTLDELRQLKGGERIHIRFAEPWGWSAEQEVLTVWRGGLLWAIQPGSYAYLRVICWSAGAKPSETLQHHARPAT